jgi:hypothetical protein
MMNSRLMDNAGMACKACGGTEYYLRVIGTLTREVRRRATVLSNFPSRASCLRLVSALLGEISVEKLTGRIYLSFQGSE